jgi:hypothetical protein
MKHLLGKATLGAETVPGSSTGTQQSNAPAPSTPTAATIGNADPAAPCPGSVVLRGAKALFDSDMGEAFIRDCARYIEGLLSDSELKFKHELSDQDWEGLARNAGCCVQFEQSTNAALLPAKLPENRRCGIMSGPLQCSTKFSQTTLFRRTHGSQLRRSCARLLAASPMSLCHDTKY